MAETTGIAWTDSTFNPWIGCTEVSTAESGGGGCDDCYARALDARHRWGGATHWGAGVPRMLTSPDYWTKPVTWNRKAAASGKPWRVFCASLADVFDNEVPQVWRTNLFRLIAKTPALTWLLLTKRIGNATPMLCTMMVDAPPLPNVWIGATIVNQREADRDVPKLLATPAAKRFVSYEPALGPVDWTKFPGIDWIIVGGASRQRKPAPAFDPDTARRTIAQCRTIGAAPFVKQLGSNIITSGCGPVWLAKLDDTGKGNFRAVLKDRAGADPAEWPEDLRVQEFPSRSHDATGER
jgi:protein gp37